MLLNTTFLRLKRLKLKDKSKKSESIVSKTQRSLAVLDRREKNINERIAKLQKRIDAVSKLGLQMQELKGKQKKIEALKEERIAEIRQLIAAFSSTVPAEAPQAT